MSSELGPGADESLLQIVTSADGNAPFTALPSMVDPARNQISTSIDAFGFFYIGQIVLDDAVFADGFEDF